MKILEDKTKRKKQEQTYQICGFERTDFRVASGWKEEE